MEVFPSILMDKYNEIIEFVETGPYSLGLERLQFEATNFVLNAGSCLILFYLMILDVLVWCFLTVIQKCIRFELVEKMRRSLTKNLFFNRFLDFFMVG